MINFQDLLFFHYFISLKHVVLLINDFLFLMPFCIFPCRAIWIREANYLILRLAYFTLATQAKCHRAILRRYYRGWPNSSGCFFSLVFLIFDSAHHGPMRTWESRAPKQAIKNEPHCLACVLIGPGWAQSNMRNTEEKKQPLESGHSQ